MRRWLASMMVSMSWVCAHPADVYAATTDYCQSSERSILFLIDRTTDYDQRDEATLVAGLDRFFKELQTGDRLLIYTIGASPTDSSRLFDACVPGCPDEGLLGGLLSECMPVVARADRQQFTRKLLTSLIGLLKEHRDYASSAIVATLESVTRANHDDRLARVVIFSDMLENSDLFTLNQLAQQGADRALGKVAAAELVPHLQGVDVGAFGLGRSHVPGRPTLSPPILRTVETFWEKLFRQGGAASVDIGLEYRPATR